MTRVITLAVMAVALLQSRMLADDGALGVSVSGTTSESPAVHERVTFRLDVEASYDNPYNSDEIRVDAVVTSGDGETWGAPAFYLEPYSGALVDGKPHLEQSGEGSWEARLSFKRPGEYQVKFVLSKGRDRATSAECVVRVRPADAPGMVRRADEDHRYFVTDRGETFFPVGANVCYGDWRGGRGLFAFDDWLPSYAEQGCNFFRLWMGNDHSTFSLVTNRSGYGRIDQESAWSADYAMALAEKLGLRVMLCFDTFQMLNREPSYPYKRFDQCPYVKVNGGSIENPEEFFTDPEIRRVYRNKLRYIVARWGYSANVFAWEFWNEVECSSNYDSEAVTAWHREMGRFIKELDPWDHLVTTSCGLPEGDPLLESLPELDFVQTHCYTLADMAEGLGRQHLACAASRQKPHFHGEFGVNTQDRQAESDPKGVYLHNGLFSSVGNQQAATPMTWFWDTYVEALDLYPVFGAFNRWLAGFDLVAQQAQPVKAQVRYLPGMEQTSLDHLRIPATERSWKAAPFNKPAKVSIARDGTIMGDVPLSGILHGLRNHPALHNDVTFEIDAPRSVRFIVNVGKVSPYGGSGLRVIVDGVSVVVEDYPEPAEMPRGGAMLDFVGRRIVPLSEGRHEVHVEASGDDWIEVGYDVLEFLEMKQPPLRVLGMIGRSQGRIWVQDYAHTWQMANQSDFQPRTISGAQLVVEGAPEGVWQIEEFDTRAGSVVKTFDAATNPANELAIPLPGVTWDIAYRLTRKP